MSPDTPFGFGSLPGGMPDPNDPKMQQMLAQLQQIMAQSASTEPVNWDLARQIAEAEMSADPAVTTAEATGITEALRLADLWLEPVTSWPTGVTASASWTRKEWLTKTLPTWKLLAEPLAEQMAGAMRGLVPEDMRAMLGPMADLMRGVGASLFGAQLGQALAALSKEVLTSTEVGLPLGSAGVAALVPANVAEYGAGLELPGDDVRLYIALREAAHHRLYQHVPWLRGHVLGTIETYARGIHIDQEAIESLVNEIDPTDPEAVRDIDLGNLFRPEDTPQQKAALARLETALALINGWVTHVVAEAAGERLPSLPRLSESARRRRATGGPAERTFSALVGLHLRPTKLRAAVQLWSLLLRERGADGRDALWAHPDLLPTSEDLDAPESFVARPAELGDLDMSMFDQLAVNDPAPEDDDDAGGDDGGPGRSA